MSAADLIALAERVEALTGACRETDAMVAAACRYFPKGVGFVWQADLRPNAPEIGRVECVTSLGTSGPHYAAPAFTVSLDAAGSLVADKGWFWRKLTEGSIGVHRSDPRMRPAARFDGYGYNDACAMVAAYLKAEADSAAISEAVARALALQNNRGR